MHVIDYIKHHLQRNAKWATMAALVLFFSFPVAGEESVNVDPLQRAIELGGPSATLILALYWLREASARRLEEARKYAEDIKDAKQRHADELKAANDRLGKIITQLMKMEEE